MEENLVSLGEEAPTPGHLRMFLSRIAMRFHNLATAPLHREYHGVDTAFFADADGSATYFRLRAFVHNVNTAFANDMRESGQTMKVVQEPETDSWEIDPPEPSQIATSGQAYVTEAEMKAFVMKVSSVSRVRRMDRVPSDLCSCTERLAVESCQEITTMSY